MLDISECSEYVAQVKDFARSIDKLDQLEKELEYLNSYACRLDDDKLDLEKTRCVLYKDWATHSFGFMMMVRDKNGEYKNWFNGGLIFYQAGDTGVGGPQYSVRLDNSTTGWSIHT